MIISYFSLIIFTYRRKIPSAEKIILVRRRVKIFDGVIAPQNWYDGHDNIQQNMIISRTLKYV